MRNFTTHYEDAEILTSRQIFKDSIYNIFLCISQFYQKDSSCEIEILKKTTTIHINFIFNSLSEQMPDISKLLRIFFTQKKNDESNVDYKMRLGLNIAIENLKRIGGNFNITSIQRGEITVFITFPSNDFLESVNDIRKHYLEMAVREHTGRVFLCCEDKVMELLLSENLSDNGFKIKLVRPEKIKGDADYGVSAAIIVDAGALHHPDAMALNLFFTLYADKKIVYISRHRESVVEASHVYNAVIPFEIQSITEFIQH